MKREKALSTEDAIGMGATEKQIGIEVSLYKNSKLRTLSIEGNTISDRAINVWNAMNYMQRHEISQKVFNYRCSIAKQRACINYVADYIL